ncbi:hypothetical protein CANINC_004661 [Pichia inconspicua]|uniref:Rho-GAP domain-containing protein n=1 Tax=Pichia inconspicua TaxID=52247 RepID=A0A4T0WXE6_9ASCO|nr:hypothetical protein CANINC_004661 [[Candida] inconspicua]
MKKFLKKAMKDDKHRDSGSNQRKRDASLNPQVSSPITNNKLQSSTPATQTSPISTTSSSSSNNQPRHMSSIEDMRSSTKSRNSVDQHLLGSTDYQSIHNLNFSSSSVNEIKQNRSVMVFENSSFTGSDIDNSMNRDTTIIEEDDTDNVDNTQTYIEINKNNLSTDHVLDETTDKLADLSIPSDAQNSSIQHRRGSQSSALTNATNVSFSSYQSEIKRAFPSKNRIPLKNRNSFSLKNSSSSSNLSSSVTPLTPSSSIQTLIKPEWDSSTLKTGWVNRITDQQEPKLFKLELKGSTLNIYKTPAELNFAKSLKVISTTNSDNASTVNSIMQNDFLKSTSDLNGIPYSPIDDSFVHTAESIMEEQIQDVQYQDKHTITHSESAVFSDIIEKFESSKTNSALHANITTTKEKNHYVIEEREEFHKLEMPSHELSYQSPSCPHPDLKIDLMSGSILDGSLEAICHTILFFPSESIAIKLVNALPMISDLNDALIKFTQYFDLFTNVTILKEKSLKLSDLENAVLYSRIQLLIETAITNFKGAFLADNIYNSLVKLLNLVKKRNPDKIADDIFNNFTSVLDSIRISLIKLTSFEIQTIDPIEPVKKSQSDLLTAEEFLSFDIDAFVHEIHAIDSHFMYHWNPKDDRSVVFTSQKLIEASFKYWRFNPLYFFPQFNTHYLGRLLAFHLFEDKTIFSPKMRAQLLTKWIQVGEKLQQQGDTCAWLGLAIVVCSQPILRLNEIWSHVGNAEISIVRKSWAPCVFEIRKQEMFSSDLKDVNTELENKARIIASDKIGEIYAKEDSVPFFGEIFTNEQLVKHSENVGHHTDVKSINSYLDYINWNLDEWELFYTKIKNSPAVIPHYAAVNSNPELISGSKDEAISNVIKNAILFNSSNGPFNLAHIMKMSIACEPPYVGKLAPFHRVSRSPLFLGSYASMLFPEILPYYEIYNKAELIGAIGGGNVLNLKELKHKTRNVFLKRVRDLFNEGNEEFKLVDDSIIFKTVDSIEPDKTTEESVKSRPSSILLENPDTLYKHTSILSVNGFSLDNYIASYQTYLKNAINLSSSATQTGNVSENNANDESTGKEIKIITTAATPDRLVDLLVLTASIFGTHIKIDDVKNYSEKTKTNGPVLLKMDDLGFTNVFFATYRMFFTTKQLIDALHKRFDGSKSAALSIANFINSEKFNIDDESTTEFPQWNVDIKDNDETWMKINWKFVAQIQLGVIESTLVLISEYFAHFMDDLETKSDFDTFLEMIDICIISEWPRIIKWLEQHTSSENVAEILSVFKSLQEAYKQVRNICIRKSYTPQIEPVEVEFSNELKHIPFEMRLPQSTDIDTIVQYVKRLDTTINSVSGRIRTTDWINTFEILQLLISDPLAMFNYQYQSSTTPPGLISISNIYDWIMTLNDGETFGSSDRRLIDALPPTVRTALKLHTRLKQYFLMQIVDPDLNIDERIDVMCTLLKIVKICRLKMRNLKLFDEAEEGKSPFIPSFIESAVETAILSPESRFFSYAWKQSVSIWKPEQLDDKFLNKFENLLPDFNEYEINTVTNTASLTICPGWIIGRLAEIASFVPNMNAENNGLINFDKNRFIYNCVTKIDKLQKKPNDPSISPYLTDFSFLFELGDSLSSLKSVYGFSSEERHREKLPRCTIFDDHIQEQIQLLKLEEQKRNLLIRQRENQIKSHFRPDDTISSISEDNTLNSNVDVTTNENSTTTEPNRLQQNSANLPLRRTTTGSSTISSQSSSNNKFKFGFFKSRLSININNFSQPNQERRCVDIEELPPAESVPNKHKPYYSINLKDVAVFPTYRTPNSFTIDTTVNHAEYTFQAATENQVSDWIYEITYARKHWFYSKILNKQFYHSNTRLTFGAPLAFVCQRDNAPIPIIIEKILSEIELRGLEEIGIYRKSASHSVVQQIKDKVNKVGDFNMENPLVFDVHNLTGLIKGYLRDLPESLIPDEYVDNLVSVRNIAKDDSRFLVYKNILSKLPMYNYNFIERLTRHMKLIEEYKTQNKMTSHNLATIMGGSMVECGKPETLKKTFGLMNFICEDWILNYDLIFQ